MITHSIMVNIYYFQIFLCIYKYFIRLLLTCTIDGAKKTAPIEASSIYLIYLNLNGPGKRYKVDPWTSWFPHGFDRV